MNLFEIAGNLVLTTELKTKIGHRKELKAGVSSVSALYSPTDAAPQFL